MIRAYFDDYNKVVIEIDKNFYDGKVNNFVLKTESEIIRLNTVEVSFDDNRILEANLDFDIDMNEVYYIDCEYGFKTEVEYRYIVKTAKFDKAFATNEKLGNFYSKEKTEFKLWAPSAKRVIVQLFGKENLLYEMNKTGGVFTTTVEKDLENYKYTYLVFVNGKVNEVVDPYSISVDNNCKHSIVVDNSKIIKLEKSLNKVNNPSVYELSVKYFTASSTTSHKYKETFKGLAETNTTNSFGDKTGIDYIADLGVSHVQLMPINDFHTMDDNHNDTFNWGYDPQHFLALKNSYCYAKDAVDQINEFKAMVQAYNNLGMGITVDVVFNHVYNTTQHAFDNIVPYYYYRTNSNGSFCGNDIATEMLMARHYALNLVDHLENTLEVDGIRFDLVGLMDVETLQQIISATNDNFILYGEGWKLPTLLDEELKSSFENASKLPNFGFFNDVFRDSLRGKNELSSEKQLEKLSSSKLQELLEGRGFVDDFVQSVNYVECHDDYTLYDKIFIQYGDDTKDVINFINAIVILSKGIAFIHSGQEALRTKNNICNTYCMGYMENNMDWDKISEHKDVVDNVKNLLAFRNTNELSYEFSGENQLLVKHPKGTIEIDMKRYKVNITE